jgi:hypothetical protein
MLVVKENDPCGGLIGSIGRLTLLSSVESGGGNGDMPVLAGGSKPNGAADDRRELDGGNINHR